MTAFTPPSPVPSSLAKAAQSLAAALDAAPGNAPRVQQLDALIRESETWLHRRASYIERDKGCYRTGAALEPVGGHRLDDIQLSGLDALGGVGVKILAETAVSNPGLSLSELLATLFAGPAGTALQAWGAWSRWHWLSALYRHETEEFLASKKGLDPRQRWRQQRPTARQTYIIEQIARLLNEPVPSFDTRGAAFEYIREQGGNPRFAREPARPALPAGA
jgi:hypothetical protein